MFSLLPICLPLVTTSNPVDGKDGKTVFSTPSLIFTNLELVSTWMNEGIQECSAFSCCWSICSIIVYSSKVCFLLQMKTEGLNMAPVIIKDEGKYLYFHDGKVSISSRALLTSLIRTSLRWTLLKCVCVNYLDPHLDLYLLTWRLPEQAKALHES